MRGKATPRPETAREGKNTMFGWRSLARPASARGSGAVRGRRDRRAAWVGLWAVVLPLLALADCDDGVPPFFPDGILLPRGRVVDPVIGWQLPVVVALVAAGVLAAGVAVVVWPRHRCRGRGRLLAGGVLGAGS
jgi:hypothetical protein